MSDLFMSSIKKIAQMFPVLSILVRKYRQIEKLEWEHSSFISPPIIIALPADKVNIIDRTNSYISVNIIFYLILLIKLTMNNSAIEVNCK